MRTGVTPDTTDRKYFTLVPHIVFAHARDAYDLAAWLAIKTIAGDNAECIMATEDLATLAGMSTGKFSSCRAHLLAVGLIDGEIRRDPGYPQPVWHLRIPDLWPENIRWREATGDSLTKRLAAITESRASLHHVKARPDEPREPSPREGLSSPGESYPSPPESLPSPGEAKKNPPIEPKEEPQEKAGQPPKNWRAIVQSLKNNPGIHSVVTEYLEPATITLQDDTLTIHTVNHSAAETINYRLRPQITSLATRWEKRRITLVIESPCGVLMPPGKTQ